MPVVSAQPGSEPARHWRRPLPWPTADPPFVRAHPAEDNRVDTSPVDMWPSFVGWHCAGRSGAAGERRGPGHKERGPGVNSLSAEAFCPLEAACRRDIHQGGQDTCCPRAACYLTAPRAVPPFPALVCEAGFVAAVHQAGRQPARHKHPGFPRGRSSLAPLAVALGPRVSSHSGDHAAGGD